MTTTTTELPEVDFDRLDREDDEGRWLLDGAPFTGVATEHDGGVRISLSGFEEGYPHGPEREWSPRGTLLTERYYRDAALHGPSRHWSADGTPEADSWFERGVCTRRSRWGQGGWQPNDYTPTPREQERLAAKRAGGDAPLVELASDGGTWRFREVPFADPGPPER
ncbi:MAG: hypothetical protein R3F59_01000 [Myxococcota bacterium]